MKAFSFFLLFFLNFLPAQERKHTAAENVKIISERFEIPQLNTTRRIWIYLPKDYEISSGNYPVLYLQDGQNLFDEATSYAGEWGIDETLNELSEKKGKSLIVVGIDNGGEARIDELSPFKNEKYNKGGKGDDYVKFMVETLKPYIDNNYRTKTESQFTAIGRNSLGTLISVYAAVKYPNVFGKVLAFSPAFWFNEKPLNAYIKNVNKDLKHQKYYFIQGRYEDVGMEGETQKVIDQLKSQKVKSKNIYFRIDEDGKHNEAYWRREFGAGVKWLMK